MFIKSTLQQLRLAVPTPRIFPAPLAPATATVPLLPPETPPLDSLLLQRFMHFFSVCIGNVCCFSSKTNATVLRPVPRPPFRPLPRQTLEKMAKLNNPRFWIFHFSTFTPNCQRRVRAEVALSQCPELAHSRQMQLSFCIQSKPNQKSSAPTPNPQYPSAINTKCRNAWSGTSSRRPLTHLPPRIFCTI